MRRCSKCKKTKPLSEFHIRVVAKGYRNSQCKLCARETSKQYENTARGKAVSAWHGLIRRANNSDGNHPTYSGISVNMTRDEFLSWALPEYERWLRDNSTLPPSVDRINDVDDYRIGNLQLISRSANSSKTRSALKIMGLGKFAKTDLVEQIAQAVCDACAKYKIDVQKVIKELKGNDEKNDL